MQNPTTKARRQSSAEFYQKAGGNLSTSLLLSAWRKNFKSKSLEQEQNFIRRFTLGFKDEQIRDHWNKH